MRQSPIFMILLAVYSHCFATGSICRTQVQLRGDVGMDEGGLEQFVIQAREEPAGSILQSSETGSTRVYAVNPPKFLYRTIVLKLQSDAYRISSTSLAFLAPWPCTAEEALTLVLSTRTGSAAEVNEMWNDGRMLEPTDSIAASLYFARAIGTALARYKSRPAAKHQYDLISAYLALRAFRIYVNLSEIPLRESDEVRHIANWYVQLFQSINRKGLQAIEKDGLNIASERQALAVFYKKKWSEILKIEPPEIALDGMQRFRQSIEAEQDTPLLLADLHLTREELVASANTFAAKIAAPKFEDVQVAKLVSNQIAITENLIIAKTVKNPLKLRGDATVLRRRLGL